MAALASHHDDTRADKHDELDEYPAYTCPGDIFAQPPRGAVERPGDLPRSGCEWLPCGHARSRCAHSRGAASDGAQSHPGIHRERADDNDEYEYAYPDG